MIEPPDQPDPPAPQPRPTVPRCVQCGYELRGLTVDGNCPECGTAVWQSGRDEAPPSGYATASMVVGIVSLFSLFACGFFAAVPGGVAIGLGIVARRHMHDGRASVNSKGQATTGITCGAIAAVLSVMFLIVILLIGM